MHIFNKIVLKFECQLSINFPLWIPRRYYCTVYKIRIVVLLTYYFRDLQLYRIWGRDIWYLYFLIKSRGSVFTVFTLICFQKCFRRLRNVYNLYQIMLSNSFKLQGSISFFVVRQLGAWNISNNSIWIK